MKEREGRIEAVSLTGLQKVGTCDFVVVFAAGNRVQVELSDLELALHWVFLIELLSRVVQLTKLVENSQNLVN